jgi:hypothetical protein
MDNTQDNLSKATVIAGIAATPHLDAQGEQLMIAGADISQMVSQGVFNDNHSSGFINTVGKITFAKKIMTSADATDSTQKDFWDKTKAPFIFVKGYLFDDADLAHPNALALSAVMKAFAKYGDGEKPLEVRMSVEGKVIDRDSNGIIKQSMIRNVALTLVPANNHTGAQVLPEDMKNAVLAKCQEVGGDIDYANALIKSLTDTHRPIVRTFIEIPDVEDAKLNAVYANVKKLNSMVKMLSSGCGSGAPTSKVGGAAITKESQAKKLKTVTPSFPKSKDRERKEKILTSLIKKIKDSHPNLPYAEVVEYAFEVYRKKEVK